ncbi:P27 family phage terminase small subunit [Bacillus cereus]|uniref:P27 family phage terminase small subunit n=1 Tax=Bacillus cereus TaxID=1396 RepID=UPI000BF55808|nr:P27 family phage terminase small subunit [Bacillus cereus]PEV03679.1 terminase [Bacillus cereus]PGM68161.1 terminase [Bacillus cereus]
MKNKAKVKRELLNRIDEENSIQVEKVERYLNLLELYYQLDEAIEEFGTMITTINGSQKFTKPNPAIAEKNKINSSLIALGKDLGLDFNPPKIGNSNTGYSKSDLT